jgi:hypothetical protein
MASVRTAPAEAVVAPGLFGRPFTAAESAGRAAQKLPKLALIAFVSLLIPAYFYVGPLLMTPSRLLFLFIVPILFFRLLGNKYGRFNVVDALFLFHVLWFTLSAAINQPKVVLTFGGSTSVVILGGYLAGRAGIRNLDDFLGFVRFFGLVVVIGAPFALYETLTHHLSISRVIELIPGVTSNKDVQYPLRMGLDRVQLVFAHPIHFGFFCSLSVGSFFFAMKHQMGNFRLWAQTAVLALMTFLSLSSGPFLAMIIQLLLLFWAHVMRKLERPWMTLVWLCTGLYVVLEVASNGPALYYIISKLAFNPATANVRRILLDYGIDQVIMTPVFGIFKRPWNLPPWMTGSLDNYWLGLAVAYGFPTFFALFMSFVVAIVKIARRDFPRGSALDRARTAWITSMVSATLTLGTVFLWNEIASFMFFFFASGLWMLDAEVRKTGTPEPAPEERQGPRYTRFEHRPQTTHSRFDTAPTTPNIPSLGKRRHER